MLPVGYQLVDDQDSAVPRLIVTGPAGPAAIKTMNDGANWEIETQFPGDKVRYYWDDTSPRAAMEHLVDLNRAHLAPAAPVATPAAVKAEPDQSKMAALGVSFVLACIGVAIGGIWAVTALLTGGEDEAPYSPTPRGPQVQVTVYGTGKYTGAECEALRATALMSGDADQASSALAKWEVHCKTITLVDSPAPTMETTR